MFVWFSYYVWVIYIFIILFVFSGLFGLGFFVIEWELEKGNLDYICLFLMMRMVSWLIEMMNSLICIFLVVVVLNY